MATYRDRIPAVVCGIIETDTKQPYKCGCHYVNGGCEIVEPAPKGFAADGNILS